MAIEHTLSIIKPDATKRNIIGKINSYLENAGLQIVAQKMVKLTKKETEAFYSEHKEKSFFSELVEYMVSAPIVLQVLKGENAVARNREIIGATDPANALKGTIRKDFAINIKLNSIHGSDNINSANREIAFFFRDHEIF